MNADDVAVTMLKLNGGKLVGRTRLQKGVYLLERCGAEFGLSFTYHHYGPYSFELAEGVLDAQAQGQIRIQEKQGRYGIPLSIFHLDRYDVDIASTLGSLSADEAHAKLKTLGQATDIVLELAATILFLRDEEGYGEQTIEELKTRKPLKATTHRIREAFALLRRLGLESA